MKGLIAVLRILPEIHANKQIRGEPENRWNGEGAHRAVERVIGAYMSFQ